jgi:hypothetical protein
MTSTTRQFAFLAAGWMVALLGAPAQATTVNQDWTARYAQGADDDQANDIDRDSAGNVYITGQCIRNTQDWDYDYITIKYNSSGQQVWAKTYNSPGNGDDRAYAIDVDSAGNVFVTGESDGDCATIKYDTNGNQIWLKRTEGACGNDIQVEPLGENNVFVTGKSGANCFTIRYNSYLNGQIVWTKTDVAGFANALAVTWGSDVCIAGQDNNNDYVVAKYAFANGNRLWLRTFDRGGVDQAHDVVVDVEANVYVTGESRTAETDWDAATVSWDLNGSFRWSAVYNGAANGWDRAYAIGLCNYGHVRIGGYSENAAGNRDFLAVKYDGASGNPMWASTYDSPDGNRDVAYDLAIDGERSVYLTGYMRNDAGDDDYMTVKFDTLGNFQWMMTYAGPNGRGYLDDEAAAITVDEEGYVFVTGKSYGPSSDDDCLTVCYSQSEDCPWDFDGDGDVDTADLLHLLGAWGTPNGDVDGDGDTDTADLLDLLAHWGQCP